VDDEPRYYRKVIRIRAEDSPNVRRGLWMESQGLVPDDKVVLPGVITWSEYKKRRATWDKVRQCVGLDGEFYEGAEVLLFPPEWLNRAESLWGELVLSGRRRTALGIGVDPGEGVAETTMYAVDQYGVIRGEARPTPDTSVIRREVIAFARQVGITQDDADRICLDRGGGGKQIADELRATGWMVRTVGFGESVQLPVRKGQHYISDRKDVKEAAYEYKNRRAQLFGELSERFDPARDGSGFAFSPEDRELRRQLAPLPKLFDEEGRLYLPPKQKRDEKDTRKTLVDILGCSPDRADGLALANFAMTHKGSTLKIEVM
jgi:hypothetical protein